MQLNVGARQSDLQLWWAPQLSASAPELEVLQQQWREEKKERQKKFRIENRVPVSSSEKEEHLNSATSPESVCVTHKTPN